MFTFECHNENWNGIIQSNLESPVQTKPDSHRYNLYQIIFPMASPLIGSIQTTNVAGGIDY